MDRLILDYHLCLILDNYIWNLLILLQNNFQLETKKSLNLQILAENALKEESINGITANMIKKYLFPRHPEFSERLFIYLHSHAKATTDHMSIIAFKQQTENLIGIMNDEIIIENYVKIYSNLKAEGDVNQKNLQSLLLISYVLAMDDDSMVTLLSAERIINAVLVSCVSINFK